MTKASPHVVEAGKNIKAFVAPLGYRVEVDDKTGNVLVIGKKFGFAVTCLFIRDHKDYLTPVMAQLENLKSAELTGNVSRPNYTVSDLIQQREATGSQVFND
jgi:hypothetical protein